jgi:hypothetical protein
MKRPSEKAQGIADELLDYVHPGMSRAAASDELAGMVDEMNADLVEAVVNLLDEAERTGPGPFTGWLNRLREVARSYTPARASTDLQHVLFLSTTVTANSPSRPGQMP